MPRRADLEQASVAAGEGISPEGMAISHNRAIETAADLTGVLG